LPAITSFIDGTGPVFSGTLFPFLFIPYVAARYGFHALISSGTTPKTDRKRENQARFIGYGAIADGIFGRHHGDIGATVIQLGYFADETARPSKFGTTTGQAARFISGLAGSHTAGRDQPDRS